MAPVWAPTFMNAKEAVLMGNSLETVHLTTMPTEELCAADAS
jgi:hypothetical protein